MVQKERNGRERERTDIQEKGERVSGEGGRESSPCVLGDLKTWTIYLLNFDGFCFSETFDLRDLPLSPTQCKIHTHAQAQSIQLTTL